MGEEATFPFSKTAARPGVDSVQLIPPNTIPRSAIQKSAAHSPRENQRSIAAMTAARRRGEFFVTIRDKLSAILSNFPKLSPFGVSPAELVFMRV